MAAALLTRQLGERIASTYSEYAAVKKTGETVWIGQHVQLVVESDARPGVHAIARDISRQKETEERLRDPRRARSARSGRGVRHLPDDRGRHAFSTRTRRWPRCSATRVDELLRAEHVDAVQIGRGARGAASISRARDQPGTHRDRRDLAAARTARRSSSGSPPASSISRTA